MPDNNLITKAKNSVKQVCEYAREHSNLAQGGIAVEIVEHSDDDLDYTSMIVGLLGKAKEVHGYRELLVSHVSDTRERLMRGEKEIPLSWEASPYTCEFRSLSFENSGADYSVMVCVVGGTEQQNRRLATCIVDDLSK